MITIPIIILLTFALITKHFICDFLLQNKYQWSNKGTYGHPGGILHAMITGIGSFIAILIVLGDRMDADATFFTGVLCCVEGVIHYHIDWAKMNINKKFSLAPNTSELFWCLLGFDQYLHYVTYIGMLIVINFINH